MFAEELHLVGNNLIPIFLEEKTSESRRTRSKIVLRVAKNRGNICEACINISKRVREYD